MKNKQQNKALHHYNTRNEGRFGVYLYWLISMLACIYVFCRSVNLSITNDEAFTFYNVATRNLKMMCGTANTHWLNSLLVFIEVNLIGNKEWMLRIHSVLAFLLFAWALFQFCKRYLTNIWQWMIPVALLILNIYLLDFFSIARGYGLSMAFEVLGFFYINQSSQTLKSRFTIYLCLSLATFSCYTALFILIAFFIHDVLSVIKRGHLKTIFSKNFMLSMTPLIAIFLVAIPNILFIRHEGDLEEGQSNGFVTDTLGVFFERSYPIFQNQSLTYFVCGMLFIFLLLFFYIFRKEVDKTAHTLFEIVLIHILIIEILFYFFNIPYIFGRTSLSFNILFWLLLVYAFAFILNKINIHLAGLCGLSLLSLCCLNIIFLKNHNTTIEWYKTQGIEECISDLEKLEGQRAIEKKLGLHLSQLGSYTNYYQYLNGYMLNDKVFSFCENTKGVYDSVTIRKMLQQDYLIMLKPYEQYLNKNQYTVMKYYTDMNADLLKILK